jgi:antitoxin (DNA-binding transcriptional repressor) of toxin-antitoxin stability system
MVSLSIEDIEQDLPAFLQRVEAGEELIITQAGRAIAEIKPIPSPPAAARPFGLSVGDFTVPDDFDEPLPEGLIQEFEGK